MAKAAYAHAKPHVHIPADAAQAITSVDVQVARLSGSYERPQWKEALRQRLRRAGVNAAPPGPVAMDIAITTGPGRSWPNLRKPLIDAFGPVLGEQPDRPFHPRDHRITTFGIHHTVQTDLTHDTL